jgi:hypothetical protein
MTLEQWGHYAQLLGDPLEPLRRLLGHASITTTQSMSRALFGG